MSITKSAVLKALSYVDDPDLKKDLVSLKMIDNIQIEGKKVAFTLILTTPACPMKEQIKGACVTAIKHFVDKEAEVNIEVTSQVTTKRQGTSKVLPNVKNIIAVASGKGGVGKSTVSVNLALALAKTGANVGLLDADIYGPSIPMMMDLEGRRPEIAVVNGKHRIMPVEQYGIKTLSIGFLAEASQAVVWRGPMASSALRQFITEAEWGDLDYLIIDLPPGTGDIHLTLVQTAPVTGAVVVTTPQDIAKADVVKAINMFAIPQINVPVLGIVENMSWFSPPELPDKKYYLFGKEGGRKLAADYQLPLLAELPIVESIRVGGDKGKPVVLQQQEAIAEAYLSLAQMTAQQVAIRNAAQAPTETVKITT